MHDPSHLYDFPVSQLPTNSQKNIHVSRSISTVALTAFEYYLYHFASLLVRRQQQNVAPTNVNVNVSNETLYVLLLEDYLSCFLPIEPATQAKLFTQPFQPTAATTQSPPTMTKPSPSNKMNVNRPSLFKKNFSPRFSEEPAQDLIMRQNESNRTASGETWRSDTLVRIFVLFWIEGYADDENTNENSPNTFNGDYVSASLKVASSLPSAELMRVIRMFIKHSHYFFNACQQGSAYLPTNLKIDIFSSKMNKALLLNYFAKAIDHWPYDASFRLVLETWLSYIQPWRYLNINSNEETKLDVTRFGGFIGDNFMFYSRLLAKVLRRFQRLDISSPTNAFMLFRVFKVFSQDGLFPCIKNTAMRQGHLFQQDSNGRSGKNENIFSEEFKQFVSDLLLTSLKCLEGEKKQRLASANEEREEGSSFSKFISSVVNFINGGNSADAGDAEKAEREKVLQHLTLVTEKMSAMFELDHVLKEFKTFPPSNERRDSFNAQQSIDQTDFLSSPNFGLSPAQRKGILNRKFKVSGVYQGNPDLVPIRSDEVTFLVRMLHILSIWTNKKFSTVIEETYFREDIVGAIFRELAAPPTTYLAHVDSVDSSLNTSRHMNSSFHGMAKQPVKLPPRIIFRPLGSHLAVSYLTIFFLVMKVIMGKSIITSVLILVFLIFSTVAIKAVVHPRSQSTSLDVPPTLYLSESFS